jgi:AraC-like DNA-binding protein/tetratricopeptide (TPR) repeat protein
MNFSFIGNKEFIKRLTELILENLGDENFGVKELVSKTGIKPSAINRRLKVISNKSISQFICEVRLNKSLELLQQDDLTVSEVAYKVGFGSPAYFNKCFHDYFGYPPGEFKKRGLNLEEEKQETIPAESVTGEAPLAAETKRPGKWALTWAPAMIVLAGLTVYLAYPRLFKRDTLENLRSSGERISIAVMPFQNLTNDTTWNIWQKGLQDVLATSLSNSEELRVRQTGSVNTLLKSKGLKNLASLTPAVAGSISQMLEANVFISGQLIKSGNVMRLDGQIINSKTEEIFKSFQIDGTAGDILSIIDSLSSQIRNFLLISEMKESQLKKGDRDFQSNKTTKSPLAFKYLISGKNALGNSDYLTAIKWFKMALAIDSTDLQAMSWLTGAYVSALAKNPTLEGEAKKCCLKYYTELKKIYPRSLDADYYYARLFGTPEEVIKILKQRLELDDQQPGLHYILGAQYSTYYRYAEAIPEYEKCLEILNKWKLKPTTVYYYYELINAYHMTGQYKKEKKLFIKAEKDYPDNTYLLSAHTRLSLKVGDTRTANEYIRKKEALYRANSTAEWIIISWRGTMYFQAGILDKAESEYREALSLHSKGPSCMKNLAQVLINHGKMNEGMELIENALRINPKADYTYLDTKAWGLYKLGRNREALALLEKCDSLKPAPDYDLFLHLQEVRKAVALENKR